MFSGFAIGLAATVADSRQYWRSWNGLVSVSVPRPGHLGRLGCNLVIESPGLLYCPKTSVAVISASFEGNDEEVVQAGEALWSCQFQHLSLLDCTENVESRDGHELP